MAFTGTYDISIFRNPGDFRDLRRARSPADAFGTSAQDFSMSSFFGAEDVEGDLLIGVLSWSGDGRFVYFDNSGVDYRCIWALDVENRSVVKIVPEHDAMHPWFFDWHGSGCVAYVVGNTVRIAVGDAGRIPP